MRNGPAGISIIGVLSAAREAPIANACDNITSTQSRACLLRTFEFSRKIDFSLESMMAPVLLPKGWCH